MLFSAKFMSVLVQSMWNFDDVKAFTAAEGASDLHPDTDTVQ